MITVEDIMTNRFLRISVEHTLREALGLVLYGEEKKVEISAIVVIDTEGEFAGIVTPETLVRGLCKASDDEGQCLELNDLQRRVETNFPDTIDSIMIKNVPLVQKDTNLPELIAIINQNKWECLPVSVEGRVEGLVFVSDIFKATAEVALTAEDEGIQLE